ncbi:MAG: hypothetical protein QXN63_00960 [Candidatus Bathyarchaeia archaeon]
MSAEKIKSELIIASKLITEIESVEEKNVDGAKKLLMSFLDALKGEIRLARNVSGLRDFDEIEAKIEEIRHNVNLLKFSEALKNVSETISFVTNIGQQAMHELAERNLL